MRAHACAPDDQLHLAHDLFEKNFNQAPRQKLFPPWLVQHDELVLLERCQQHARHVRVHDLEVFRAPTQRTLVSPYHTAFFPEAPTEYFKNFIHCGEVSWWRSIPPLLWTSRQLLW